jgi:hypothetical protein
MKSVNQVLETVDWLLLAAIVSGLILPGFLRTLRSFSPSLLILLAGLLGLAGAVLLVFLSS